MEATHLGLGDDLKEHIEDALGQLLSDAATDVIINYSEESKSISSLRALEMSNDNVRECLGRVVEKLRDRGERIEAREGCDSRCIGCKKNDECRERTDKEDEETEI